MDDDEMAMVLLYDEMIVMMLMVMNTHDSYGTKMPMEMGIAQEIRLHNVLNQPTTIREVL
jgi:hypothetical protein